MRQIICLICNYCILDISLEKKNMSRSDGCQSRHIDYLYIISEKSLKSSLLLGFSQSGRVAVGAS